MASAEEAIEETLTFHRLSRQHTPIIEPLSLDEAYLDVTENLQGIPLARDVALAIRAKIKETTGAQRFRRHLLQQVPGEARLRSP